MKYQALYRKYRPSKFTDLAGQQTISDTLMNAVKNERISHAYLFTGPRGTGKTSIAKIFAKMVNCEHLEEGEPCNHCSSCEQINKNQNPDIIEIDAASNNGVDEIREIRSKVNLAPSMSKYKVYIIDEVHMLSTGAFNALLKTLEEPPSHIIFILATTDPQKLPSTIISRCQRFDFQKIDTNSMVNRLQSIAQQENLVIDNSILYEIANVSDGGMRDAISLLDQLVSYRNENITISDVHDINGTITNQETYELILDAFSSDINRVLDRICMYDQNGKNIAKISELLIFRLRDLLVYKKAKEYFRKNVQLNVSEELLEKITVISEGFLYQLIQSLEDSFSSIKNTANARLALELVFLKTLDGVSKSNVPSKIEKSQKEQSTLSNEKQKQHEIVDKNQNSSSKSVSSVNKFSEVDPKFILQNKNIRVNNTLYYFDKEQLSDMRIKWNDIRRYLTHESFGSAASLLLDGKLQVAGHDYVLLVYKIDSMAYRLNTETDQAEALLYDLFRKVIKVVGVTVAEWEKIFQEYQTRKQKNETYSLMEEITKKEPEKNAIIDDVELEAKSLFGEETVEVS